MRRISARFPLQRKRGFGLVEDVEAIRAEAVEHEREERLAVGLLVKRDAAVAILRRPGCPSISVATLKKLSARRKKPVRGVRVPRTSRRYSCNSECDSRVETVMLRLPPSALNPAATAIASTSVDLPLPFSPAKNVTCGSRGNSSSVRIAGIENG